MNWTHLRQDYYQRVFGKEDPILEQIRHLAKQEGIEYMQLNPADARILQILTQISGVKKAVEIGGLYGYSTLHIARGLPKEGQVFSLDMDSNRQTQSKNVLKHSSEVTKIHWILGKAHQTLPSLTSQSPFDLVFIDADKSSYLDYLYWAEKNLKVGGLVIADNTFLFHTMYAKEPELSQLRKIHHVSEESEKTLKAFNKRITHSSHWKGAMIPTEDGLSVAIKTKEVCK